MADLFDRLTNQPVQTIAPSGVPSVDFAAGREAVRTQQTFSNAMNRISDFAFKDAQRTAQIRGGMAGAEDPRGTLLDLKDRDPATLNIPESAAYEAAIKGLSNQIQVEAKSAMGVEYLKSVEAGETPDQLTDRLDAITVGYSDVVGMLSPDAAQAVTLTLDNQRNAHFLNFSEDYLKQERVKARAVGASNLENMNFAIEDMARSTLGDIDKYIDESANNIYEMLIGQEYSEVEATNEMLKAKRRAHVSRINGEFNRLETVDEKLEYAARLEKDIGKPNGLSRGLPNSNAMAIANSLRLSATREQNALNGELANVGQDLNSDVISIVSSAGIPSQRTIKDINSRIAALEEAGADKGKIAELKEAVTMAEDNIDYLRTVKGYNLDQLQAEHDRLESAIVEEEMATPSDMMRFKIIKSKLSSAISEANAQNTAWGKSATAIGKKIDGIQKIVDDFNPVDPAMFQSIGQDIEALRESGAPEELVDALNVEYQIMFGRGQMFNDLADDTALELEAKLNKFRAEAREDGYTVSENEIINLMDGRLTAMTTGLNKDPLSWANGSGVIALDQTLMMMALNPDFDPLSPEVQGVVQQRRQDANAVVSHYGTQRRLLTDAEGEQLANAIVDADPQLQMAYLMRVNQVFGADTVEALDALNKQAPILAHMGGLMVDQTSPQVMERMTVGLTIKDGMEDRAYGELTDMREQNITTFGGLTETSGVAKFVDNSKKIADYYYLGSGGSSSGSFDADLYEDAIQYATGMVEIGSKRFGGIVTYNDTQVILPNNIPQDDIDDIMEFATEEDFLKVAVVQDKETGEYLPYDKMPVGVVNNLPFDLNDISRYRLITVGDGIYKLRHPYNPQTMFTSDGEPYLIDLKRYSE